MLATNFQVVVWGKEYSYTYVQAGKDKIKCGKMLTSKSGRGKSKSSTTLTTLL